MLLGKLFISSDVSELSSGWLPRIFDITMGGPRIVGIDCLSRRMSNFAKQTIHRATDRALGTDKYLSKTAHGILGVALHLLSEVSG